MNRSDGFYSSPRWGEVPVGRRGRMHNTAESRCVSTKYTNDPSVATRQLPSLGEQCAPQIMRNCNGNEKVSPCSAELLKRFENMNITYNAEFFTGQQ